MSVPTMTESELRKSLDRAVHRLERAFAGCPPVEALADDDALVYASRVVNQAAEDLQEAEALANSLACLAGVTQSALMVTCAARVAFELVRSALSILRAEIDARLAA